MITAAAAIAAIALGMPGAVDRPLAAPALAADLFDDLYARGQKTNANLKTLTAAFVETSTSALLVKPLVALGRVYVERPARVLLRYTEPDDRTVLIDGDRMTVVWPAIKVRTTTDIGAAQRRIQKYFVDSSPRELRSHFEVTAVDASDRPGAYAITMTPKRKQIEEGLARLELWVDQKSLLLAGMRMTFPGGETKLMTFTDVVPNAPIEPSIFSIAGVATPGVREP